MNKNNEKDFRPSEYEVNTPRNDRTTDKKNTTNPKDESRPINYTAGSFKRG